MEVIVVTAILVVFIYAFLIIAFAIVWCYNTQNNIYKNSSENIKSDLNEAARFHISVVITIRNESNNIKNCINSIFLQNTENLKVEIIIADDNSTDNSVEIINSLINYYRNHSIRIKLIEVKSNEPGKGSKKHAQQIGIANAEGDIIVLTDADCVFGTNWLLSLTKVFSNNNVQLVSGPVMINSVNSIWAKMQALEFSSLVISGGASVQLGLPVMCNAANLAFRKSAHARLTGDVSNESISSGDDVFLMSHFKKKYGSKALVFVNDFKAIVFTRHQKTLSSFISQRIRWASKASSYKDNFQIILSLVVLSANLSIVFLLGVSLLSPLGLMPLIIALLTKALSDFVLLFAGLNDFKSKRLLIWFLPLLLIYPFYIMLVSVAGFFIKPDWKGRRIKTGNAL